MNNLSFPPSCISGRSLAETQMEVLLNNVDYRDAAARPNLFVDMGTSRVQEGHPAVLTHMVSRFHSCLITHTFMTSGTLWDNSTWAKITLTAVLIWLRTQESGITQVFSSLTVSFWLFDSFRKKQPPRIRNKSPTEISTPRRERPPEVKKTETWQVRGVYQSMRDTQEAACGGTLIWFQIDFQTIILNNPKWNLLSPLAFVSLNGSAVCGFLVWTGSSVGLWEFDSEK